MLNTAQLFGDSSVFAKAPKTQYKNAVCVAVDDKLKKIEFCSMENGDRGTVNRKSYDFVSPVSSVEFKVELTDAAKDFVTSHGSFEDTSVTLVLPNRCFAMDTLNIPNQNRRKNDESADATISGLYKNRSGLHINRFFAAQNKQIVTYSLTVVSREIVRELSSALEEAGMKPTCVTFAANAITAAAAHLSPRLKTASYLLMDVKKDSTCVCFVAKGKTSGFYDLPFGYSILVKNKVAAEDMLFDHSVSELAVLNAREKARAKKLTMMGGEAAQETDENGEKSLDALFGGDENATVDPTTVAAPVTIKTLPKKVPRKLPKFMLRPEPQNEEEISFESFRIFMKWALTLIDGNMKLTMQGEPEAVYINMPAELDFLYDMANAEKQENGIDFASLDIRSNGDDISESMEIFGGLYALQGNRTNLVLLG